MMQNSGITFVNDFSYFYQKNLSDFQLNSNNNVQLNSNGNVHSNSSNDAQYMFIDETLNSSHGGVLDFHVQVREMRGRNELPVWRAFFQKVESFIANHSERDERFYRELTGYYEEAFSNDTLVPLGVLMDYGTLLIHMNKKEEAKTYFAKISANHPELTNPLLICGTLWQDQARQAINEEDKLKFYNEAIDYYLKANKTEDLQPYSFLHLARIYYSLGNHVEAVKMYRQYFYRQNNDNISQCQRIQSNWESYLQYGDAFFKIKNYEDAEKAFENAILKNPSHFDSWKGLISALRAQHKEIRSVLECGRRRYPLLTFLHPGYFPA